MLERHLSDCVVHKSRLVGINREASQMAFYQQAADGMPQVTALTGDNQLTMWMALQIFNQLLDAMSHNAQVHTQVGKITSEEADIAHYIGGCVISKLRKRSRTDGEREVLSFFVSEEAPEEGTLVNVKSRGRLTNITKDTESMFVELEQVFRDIFPHSDKSVSEMQYKDVCYKNQVIQDCFFNSVHSVESTSDKEKIFSKILHLFFKIRVHHKCKIIIDKVRSKSKVSSKDRSLRAKLAK